MRKARMPVYMKLVNTGASTWNAQTIYPSVTLPSHVSMLSGIRPEVHKVLWNDWFKENGVFSFPTVFSLAKKDGLRTAIFAAKKKFKHFEVPGTLDTFQLIESSP